MSDPVDGWTVMDVIAKSARLEATGKDPQIQELAQLVRWLTLQAMQCEDEIDELETRLPEPKLGEENGED